MGHASARGCAHLWANQTRHRPDHDAPMTTEQAMAGARAGTYHAPNGTNPKARPDPMPGFYRLTGARE